jgi:DNA (cytosine-5)-methyltransferase 1
VQGGDEVKYISICSGIEAASTAWHGLGWTPLAFSEIEPFPSAVLAQRYPDVPNLGDMSKFREWPEELLAECDLLVGGTPCQAFSVAGLRKSLDDERGNLSLIYVHLFHHINEVRKRHGRPPAIALWENVPGVLSTKDNAFGCFISGLLGVDDTIETQDGKWPKAGFLGSETVRVGYRVLDAQYFAVAQRRRRVFLVAVPCELVASLGGRACPSEILSLRESVLGNPPTRGAEGEVASAGFAGSSGDGVAKPLGAHSLSKGRGTDLDNSTYVAFTKAKRAQSVDDDESWVPGEVAPTQNQFDVGDTRATTVVAFTTEQTPKFKEECALTMTKQSPSGGGQPQCVAFTQNSRDEVRQIDGDGQIVGALSAEAGMHQTNYLAFANHARDGFKVPEVMKDGVTPALTNPGNGGRADAVNVATHMQVRRLTPTECCRLQGFPDDHCDVTFRKKPAADGPKYRALGNSMAVPCMAWLGYRIHLATHRDTE